MTACHCSGFIIAMSVSLVMPALQPGGAKTEQSEVGKTEVVYLEKAKGLTLRQLPSQQRLMGLSYLGPRAGQTCRGQPAAAAAAVGLTTAACLAQCGTAALCQGAAPQLLQILISTQRGVGGDESCSSATGSQPDLSTGEKLGAA